MLMQARELVIEHQDEEYLPLHQLDRMIALANKIKSLKEMDEGRESLQLNYKKFSKEMSTLKSYRIVLKNRIENPYDLVDLASFKRNMKAVCDDEKLPRRQEMAIPSHLQCLLSGEVMQDPVMIESGQSYEREVIMRYF